MWVFFRFFGRVARAFLGRLLLTVSFFRKKRSWESLSLYNFTALVRGESLARVVVVVAVGLW